VSAISATPAAVNGSVRRPGLLTAAISIVVVTALATIANGVIIATGGKELVTELLKNAGLGDFSGSDLDLLANLGGYESFDGLVSSFTTRGYIVAAGGVILLLLGIFMGKAATWARVLVTIMAPVVMVLGLVVLADLTNGAMAGLSMLALLGGILSIIFTWLPANGRYAKALRQS